MHVYYPYFRAKTFEVKAVIKAAQKLSKTKKVLPIFEPVVKKSPKILIQQSNSIAQSGLPVALIMNPSVGELIGKVTEMEGVAAGMRAKGAEVWPALIINTTTTAKEITDFLPNVKDDSAIFIHRGVPGQEVLNELQKLPYNHIFIDGLTSISYHKVFPKDKRVLIKDGFQIKDSNIKYEEKSFFGDLHLTYADQGYQGFGDFSIIGQTYKTGGGQPRAVVIHMTEQGRFGLECNHFLSVTNQTVADKNGKILEALKSLADYHEDFPDSIGSTDAGAEYLKMHEEQKTTSLGELKRLSMQHHLELMTEFI